MLYHNGDIEGLTDWKQRSIDNIFGDWLFFGKEKNLGIGGYSKHNYSIDPDLLNSISIKSLAYRHDLSIDAAQKVIADFSEIADIDMEASERYLTEEEEFTCVDAEIVWKMQMHQAELAKVFGYDCVAVSDEYGTSYMIDMTVHFKNMLNAD